MKVLEIRLPEADRAYELFRSVNGDIIVTVHGDGRIHVFAGEKARVINPNEDMRIVDRNDGPVWRSFSCHR